MNFFVIYDHPKDFPDSFVMRRQTLEVDGKITFDPTAFLADTLEEVRRFVPRATVKMNRSPHDDPAIVEVWI